MVSLREYQASPWYGTWLGGVVGGLLHAHSFGTPLPTAPATLHQYTTHRPIGTPLFPPANPPLSAVLDFRPTAAGCACRRLRVAGIANQDASRFHNSVLPECCFSAALVPTAGIANQDASRFHSSVPQYYTSAALVLP